MREEKQPLTMGPSSRLHLTPAHMREGENCLSRVRYHHMREREKGLVCAEKIKRLYFTDSAIKIFAAKNDAFVYQPNYPGFPGGTVYYHSTGELFKGCPSLPSDISVFRDGDTDGHIALFSDRVSFFYPTSKIRDLSTEIGGTAGATHHDRYFFVNGDRLYYTAPLSLTDIENSEKDPDGAGYIDLISGDGDFVAVVSFRERLYLFRERGLVRMRADGDPLNFRAEVFSFGCGEVVAGSVVNCGDRIAFLTDRGLFTFNGSVFKQHPLSALADIDYSGRIDASSLYGNYFVSFTSKEGNRTAALYEFDKEHARLLSHTVVSAVGGELGYILQGLGYYEMLEEGGLPDNGADCILELCFSWDAGRSPATIRIEGEGSFTVTAQSGGRSKSFTVPARKTCTVPVLPASRDVRFTVSVADVNFSIAAIDLEWREIHD